MPSYGKENFKESNVNYLNKDFTSLKTSLMNYAKSYFPNSYRDFNETSPGMMLLEMNAYVGDVLSFYVDQQYREMLLPLAEERRNIINMAKMFGYKVKPIVPAYVDLTFYQDLDAMGDDTSKVDYTTGGIFDKGIQVKATNKSIVFETLDVLDFQISSSQDTSTVSSTNDSTELAETYTLERTVRAVSGKEKTASFTIGAPEKFKKITISDKNVIDIISCVDSNGNNWYEVDFLAQDKVPIETHYTQDGRTNAYQNIITEEIENIAVPYSLGYIKTSKRFTRETNVDNTTSLIFGNGILRDGNLVTDGFIDLEQVGIVVPGQTNDLNEAINPLLGDEYSTLGETPNNTTLTITYRVGGGINSNVPVSDLTTISTGTSIGNSGATISDLTVTNLIPARGGKDEEHIDEIREKTKAFFTTQNRCVTKEDYEARVLNVPSKFGNIAKVYVSRSDEDDQLESADVEYFSNQINNAKTSNISAQDVVDDIYSIVNDPEQSNVNKVANIQAAFGELDNNNKTVQESMAFTTDQLDAVTGTLSSFTDYSFTEFFTSPSISVYVLAYDNSKNLVGNPMTSYTSVTDNVPSSLLSNIKNYLNNFKILTDTIVIRDGYIINFGVFFDVVAEKYANKQKVKLRCIEIIKEYFRIDKMQFNQPIYVSQLEYELMGVEGVRSINHITITQSEDYHQNGSGEELNEATWNYSFDTELDSNPEEEGTEGGFVANGTGGYNYKYNFQNALEGGIIRPPLSSTPAVFELKNSAENIKGRVR